MVVFAVGDICGEEGIAFVERKLPAVRRMYGVDMIIANAENCAKGGKGITKDGADRIFSAGVDVITTGNHAFNIQGYENLFDSVPALIRPYNLGKGIPGAGSFVFDMGRCRVLVVNLMGRAFMPLNSTDYFDAMDDILISADTPVIIVDFHAEATAEKLAFARCFDGRASLVFGTHTHVPTADETILPGGTGYITDIGMTGPVDSVIGIDTGKAISKQRFAVPVRLVPALGFSAMSGILSEIDNKTGKALSIERLAVGE